MKITKKQIKKELESLQKDNIFRKENLQIRNAIYNVRTKQYIPLTQKELIDKVYNKLNEIVTK